MVMRSLDLDGSGRIALEEHYFKKFADRNRDGKVMEHMRWKCLVLKGTQLCILDVKHTQHAEGYGEKLEIIIHRLAETNRVCTHTHTRTHSLTHSLTNAHACTYTWIVSVTVATLFGTLDDSRLTSRRVNVKPSM